MRKLIKSISPADWALLASTVGLITALFKSVF